MACWCFFLSVQHSARLFLRLCFKGKKFDWSAFGEVEDGKITNSIEYGAQLWTADKMKGNKPSCACLKFSLFGVAAHQNNLQIIINKI